MRQKNIFCPINEGEMPSEEQMTLAGKGNIWHTYDRKGQAFLPKPEGSRIFSQKKEDT